MDGPWFGAPGSTLAATRLRSVAALDEPPDLVVSGARVLNVFTKSVARREIGVAAGRIAWVLPPEDAATLGGPSVLDLREHIVVPGLIEPHAHPELLYGPLALSVAAARHGTTTLCADLLTFTTMLDDDGLLQLVATCANGPARMLWALRASAEGGGHVADRLAAQRLIGLLDRLPTIATVGEMTAWRELVDGDDRLTSIVDAARQRAKRVNGHLPGASRHSLQRAAVAGISDDHEATTADEAALRIENGFWVMVRHSSLRPDARGILAGLLQRGLPTDRVMLTTDGPVAADLAAGHLDVVIREAVLGGVDPVDAVRLATLHPATYLGLDAHIGSVAPGRYADLIAVTDLENFDVQSVLIGGQPPTPAPAYPPGLIVPAVRQAQFGSELLRDLASSAPTVRFDGIITRAESSPPPCPTIAALVARDGSWLVAMTVSNVKVTAMASSYSGTGDILLMGTDPAQMVEVYRRLVAMGSGIVSTRTVLPLPLLGTLSTLEIDPLARIIAKLSDEVHIDGKPVPLEFLILFLGLGVLPDVRLTPGGVLEVKTGRILSHPTPLIPSRPPAILAT